MVYQRLMMASDGACVMVGGRQRATCSSANRRAFLAAGLVYVTMIFSLMWTVLAFMHYTDPKTAQQNYCQQNHLKKQQLGQEDVLDDPTTVCMSSIVLEYSVEQLESPLRAAYLAQAVTGALLAAAAPPALVGALFDQLRVLLVIWAAADVIWCSALVGSVLVLAPFGFPTFVPMLAGSAAVCLLLGIVVLCCGLKKSDDQKHSDCIELSQQDPERGEQDHKPCEEEAKTGENMSRSV